MAEIEKTTTLEYYVCRKCEKKMITMTIKSSGFDLFGIGGDGKAFYCDNKECEHFGFLTIAGIKKTE
jgi:hypothetical protein